MLKEIFRGFIRLHILYHAAQGPIYGQQIREELARHGYQISPGTLYPTLHALERAGYLQSERQSSRGRICRYYAITPLGQEALDKAREKLRELVDEVLNDPTPKESNG